MPQSNEVENKLFNPKDLSMWKNKSLESFIENMVGEIGNDITHIRAKVSLIISHPELSDVLDSSLLKEITLKDLLLSIVMHCDNINSVIRTGEKLISED